ncbi:MAG TPA: bZIP transcription factor [Candidatus Binataceae bacterium]|nr:bZIP transcription factor [Candidatus Binataceae bacterium]
MNAPRIPRLVLLVLGIAIAIPTAAARADDSSDPKTLRAISRELKRLEQDRSHDRDEIQRLEKRVEQLETENTQLKASSTEVKTETTQTAQAVKQIQTQQAQAQASSQDFSGSFDRYLGSHSFTVTGAAGVEFIYDQQPHGIDGIPRGSQNTFLADWEPMILYRPTDWILFEGVGSFSFGQNGTGADLSTANFQLFLNDYLTVVGGLFDQPFGDWYENQSPMWVNRFITAPLPFAVEPVVPPAEVGVQLRGGLQWGAEGQDVDYTMWTGTGPSFSEPIPGAVVSSPTPIRSAQTNGKAFGGRLRFYPIPVDSDWGRLELGASTYNGKWMGGNWFTSWGVDFNYLMGNLQTRGEFLRSYRSMPAPYAQDNREGWYLQVGYFLNGVGHEFLPDIVQKVTDKTELLVRYSGVNQHFVDINDITSAASVGSSGINVGLLPDFGVSGSPSLYAPHAREVALGVDYWITPSIVWQNELDLELPRAGGVFTGAQQGPSSLTQTVGGMPVGSTPNDRAFLTQFTIGF